MQRHLQEYFQLPGHTGFSQDTMLLSLIRPIPGQPLSMNITLDSYL